MVKVYCIVVTFHSLGTEQSKAFMVKGIHLYTPHERYKTWTAFLCP
jgi:hypothetical protein